jgi:hypothetical protein
MKDPILVCEWGVDRFHKRVLEREPHGTSRDVPDHDSREPGAGYVVHLYTTEMIPVDDIPAREIA